MSWHIHNQNENVPDWTKGWFVHQEEISYKTRSKEEAELLAFELNSKGIKQDDENFEDICHNVLKMFRKQGKSQHPKVLVFVEGGVVSDVVFNDKRVEVIVVDYDVERGKEMDLKKDQNNVPCHMEVWRGCNEYHYNPEEIRYWKSKNRGKKLLTSDKVSVEYMM